MIKFKESKLKVVARDIGDQYINKMDGLDRSTELKYMMSRGTQLAFLSKAAGVLAAAADGASMAGVAVCKEVLKDGVKKEAPSVLKTLETSGNQAGLIGGAIGVFLGGAEGWFRKSKASRHQLILHSQKLELHRHKKRPIHYSHTPKKFWKSDKDTSVYGLKGFE